MVTFKPNAPTCSLALNAAAQNSEDQSLYRLLWRQGRLLIMPPNSATNQISLAALAEPNWFQAFIARSKTWMIVIDSRLSIKVINIWSQACHCVGKPLYLRLSAKQSLSAKQNLWTWHTWYTLERLISLVSGDMPLMGTKSWSTDQTDRVPAEFWCCLRVMPGIVDPRTLGLKMSTADIGDTSQRELLYLKNLTLWSDSQTEPSAVVEMLTGSDQQSSRSALLPKKLVRASPPTWLTLIATAVLGSVRHILAESGSRE